MLPSRNDRSPIHLVLFSAHTQGQLAAWIVNLRDFFRQHPDVTLNDAASTLMVACPSFAHRRFSICSTIEEAIDQATSDPWESEIPVHEPGERKSIFLFPGTGSEHLNMGRELYEVEPRFRAAVDRCSALLHATLGFDLRSVLYPEPKECIQAADQFSKATISSLALFTVEYALAELFISIGVQPCAMIGASLGEYVAACLSGVFSLQDALGLVAFRGRLLETLPRGEMLTVHIAMDDLAEILGRTSKRDLTIAAVNAPDLCTVSGAIGAIALLKAELDRREVDYFELQASVAGHSPSIESVLREFYEFVSSLRLHPPSVPFISNATGGWATADAARADYWVAHFRESVRLDKGLETVLATAADLLLDLGPARTLTTLVRTHPGRKRSQLVFPCMSHPRDRHSDLAYFYQAVGQLWLHGFPVDWNAFVAGKPFRRAALPNYPSDSRDGISRWR